MTNLPSPFTTPMPGLRIKEGVPPLTRPSKTEIATFPTEAKTLLTETWAEQESRLKTAPQALDWLADQHFLLAGATGPGLGGSIAIALLNLMRHTEGGSLTVIGRDLSKSVGYETGKLMQAQADAAGFGSRFHWLNSGMALEGRALDKILTALKDAGAKNLIYINGVAAASSGLLPGAVPVYVMDVDEEGLFQWKLPYLDEKAIAATRFVMGEMAVTFPQVLEDAGLKVKLSVFADWRGSLDRISRDPSRPEYGRQGAYSTSLYLPKEVIHQAVSANYGTDTRMIDILYPIMRTRALPLIPGGTTMSLLYEKLMALEGIRRIDIPELALNTLEVIRQVLLEGYDNPFPRLDKHELPLDVWFNELVWRLNEEEDSRFYYKHWLAE